MKENSIDEAIRAAIPGYLENRRNDLEKLKHALEIKELKVIARIAHNIVGTAESYGQKELGKVAFQLDQAVEDEDWQEIKKKILEIEKILKC